MTSIIIIIQQISVSSLLVPSLTCDLIKLSKNIEKEMNLAADLLEFELAARLRDELKELRREINSITE